MKTQSKLLFLAGTLLLVAMGIMSCGGKSKKTKKEKQTYKTTYRIAINDGTNTEVYEGVSTDDMKHSPYAKLNDNHTGITVVVDGINNNSNNGLNLDIVLDANNNILPFGTDIEINGKLVGSGQMALTLEHIGFLLHTMYWNDPEYVKGTHSISNVVLHPSKQSAAYGDATFRYEFNNIMLRGHIDPNQVYTISGHILCVVD